MQCGSRPASGELGARCLDQITTDIILVKAKGEGITASEIHAAEERAVAARLAIKNPAGKPQP